MIKKELFLGLLVGLIANALGIFFAVSFLSNGDDFITVINAAIAEGFIGKLVSLGALLNIIVFFLFLKRNQDYRARGVLLATVLVALITFIIKL